MNVSAVVVGAAISVFSHYDKKKTAIVLGLCVSAINGILVFVRPKERSSETPAITASPLGHIVRIIAANPDYELPIKDVSAKVQGFAAVQIGTMYPRVVNEFADLTVKSSTVIVVSVWYNETERMEADFDVKMNPDSTLTIETTYLDAKGVDFVPEWKQRALKGGPDTASTHYNPTLFK